MAAFLHLLSSGDGRHFLGSKQSQPSFRHSFSEALFPKQCRRYHLINTSLAPDCSVAPRESDSSRCRLARECYPDKVASQDVKERRQRKNAQKSILYTRDINDTRKHQHISILMRGIGCQEAFDTARVTSWQVHTRVKRRRFLEIHKNPFSVIFLSTCERLKLIKIGFFPVKSGKSFSSPAFLKYSFLEHFHSHTSGYKI